jgi:hypothetical protein
MIKTITIDGEVYQLLKHGNSDSFTKVLRRHAYKPAETYGELLDCYLNELPPSANPRILARIIEERARRSAAR